MNHNAPDIQRLIDALALCLAQLARIENPTHAENLALINGIVVLEQVGADVTFTRAPTAVVPIKKKGMALSGVRLTLPEAP
ncbi:MAG: hypothetical protein RLZZ182_1853 [Pseudomonadota bacterium]